MGLKLFAKNLVRLFNIDLKKHKKLIRKHETLETMLDNLKYEIADQVKDIELPQVVKAEETIKVLYSSHKSMARFGDGEFNLIEGRDIGFQKSSPEISKRLAEVLKSNDENILIGIPDVFGSLDAYCQHVRSYWREFLPKNRHWIYQLLDLRKTYYDACFTGYAIQSAEDDEEALKKYYNEIRKIWQNRDVVFIKGKDTETYVNDIYDNVKSAKYIYAPKAHAFEHYNEILNEARKESKDKLFIVILGPAATILAYDLAKSGYQALDMGHLAKDYDWFMRKEEKIVGKFFAS